MEPNREINREPVRESQKPRIDPAVLREEIFNVLSTLAKVKKEDVKLEDRLSEDLNLDSLARMEALGMLCDKFEIDPDLEKVGAIQTVGDVLTIVEKSL
jgi:acyl carrier protein